MSVFILMKDRFILFYRNMVCSYFYRRKGANNNLSRSQKAASAFLHEKQEDAVWLAMRNSPADSTDQIIGIGHSTTTARLYVALSNIKDHLTQSCTSIS